MNIYEMYGIQAEQLINSQDTVKKLMVLIAQVKSGEMDIDEVDIRETE